LPCFVEGGKLPLLLSITSTGMKAVRNLQKGLVLSKFYAILVYDLDIYGSVAQLVRARDS
jgi:hypothetical protein